MLCSISTGKSGSKWLDRLRSSKGFPAGNDLDLEQFLNGGNLEISNSSDTKLADANIDSKLSSISAQPSEKPVLDRNQTTTISREDGEREWLGIVSNVLVELFNMGNSDNFPRIHGKKSSRKQPNPKICVRSTSSNGETEKDVSAALPSSGDNSCAEIKQTNDPIRLMKVENVDVDVGSVDVDHEEDEKSHADFSGFSRTEVTVIDSSDPSWKCEKLLFRRKNVWKVREKKSKSTSIGIKKRRANSLEEAGGEKKPKRCTSSKDASGEAHMMTQNNLMQVHMETDKMTEDHKKTPDIVKEAPKKRFPRKSHKCGSSVILIKSVPKSKKNGASIPKNCLKS